MTSASTFPQRLTKIDDLARPDHFYLTADDECYFLGEYTARKGFAFSPTNQLILNFKKSMDDPQHGAMALQGKGHRRSGCGVPRRAQQRMAR